MADDFWNRWESASRGLEVKMPDGEAERVQLSCLVAWLYTLEMLPPSSFAGLHSHRV